VVGGSHHEPRRGLVNAESFAIPAGNVLGRYEKLRPYASERAGSNRAAPWAKSRSRPKMLVLICADFWFADVFPARRRAADLVLVPALSVTRKPVSPIFAHAVAASRGGTRVRVRLLRRHQRLGSPIELPLLFPAVSRGLQSHVIEPELLFQPVGSAAVRAYPIDFDALDAFRKDRLDRGSSEAGGSMTDAERLRRVGLWRAAGTPSASFEQGHASSGCADARNTIPAFRKYPPLPVVRCSGYERAH
jgi:hypothetical protein